ncbi:MAG: YceI family protein [Cyclobacteriaceae bacterium]|nr:YceI family protein [Cyclobacteriaceae bacterium]
MKTLKKLGVILVLALTVGFSAKAQSYTLAKESSSLLVEGTSTLHDWEEKAEKLGGTAQIVMEGNKLVEIKQLTFKVDVESLKSEHSGMDSNTYKALDSKTYPEITYELTKINSTKPGKNGIVLSTTGKLTIKGVSKTITMDVDVMEGSVVFAGETTFKMSEYGVEPPTALMGTIKTGDEVTIKFKVKYVKQ